MLIECLDTITIDLYRPEQLEFGYAIQQWYFGYLSKTFNFSIHFQYQSEISGFYGEF